MDSPADGAGQQPKRDSRLPYMPGVDGLRAVAVLAVFFYHVGVGWMPGGWLGVDLFFVISGYLITSLLLQEYERNNHINVLAFWLRRARRLLPAVAVLIAGTLILAALFARDDIDTLRGDAIASLFYVQNWHLIITDQSYFEAFQRPSLLRHLWSLSVEEQFYLLWPIVCAAGMTRLSRRRLLAVVIGGIAISTLLVVVFYSPGGDVDRAFYGSDTRAAALLVGVALALVWTPGELPSLGNKRLGRVLDVLGLIALFMVMRDFVTFRDFDASSYEFGLLGFALWSGLLVGALAHPATSLNKVLGLAPVVWLGLRSYSFYLWHWPVITLTRPEIDVSMPRGILITLQLGVTLVLAHLSYTYVEQPFRRKRGSPQAPSWLVPGRIALAAGVVLTVILVGWGGLATEGPTAEEAAAAAETDASPSDLAATDVPVLAIGDSVMLASEPQLRRRLGEDAIIDAAEARQAGEYPEILASYRSAGQLPQQVVVHVGNNGPVYYEDVAALREALNGVPHVYLVNVEVPRQWESQVNDELNEALESWPEAELIDWQSAIDAVPEDTYDGIHPTPEGAKIYASLIADALAADVAPEEDSESTETTSTTGE